jgi:hypothetical protein
MHSAISVTAITPFLQSKPFGKPSGLLLRRLLGARQQLLGVSWLNLSN